MVTAEQWYKSTKTKWQNIKNLGKEKLFQMKTKPISNQVMNL